VEIIIMKNQGNTHFNLENELAHGAGFSELLEQRRKAIDLFLHSPADTFMSHPELGLELITFFSRSTNPYFDQNTGHSVLGSEIEFERWEATRKWAQEKQKA
jgi:hypothetical protein